MWIGKRIKDKRGLGEGKCARCGKNCKLTVDHFIPKSKIFGLDVNRNGNYVGLCEKCNKEKADKIVTPDWYVYVSEEKKENLKCYMRYTRSILKNITDDPEILEYLEKL